jgi:hypothetical protein
MPDCNTNRMPVSTRRSNGEREAPKQKMHIGNARHGYHGPSLPSGVRTGQKIEKLRSEDEQS